jgi:hypothetical protein
MVTPAAVITYPLWAVVAVISFTAFVVTEGVCCAFMPEESISVLIVAISTMHTEKRNDLFFITLMFKGLKNELVYQIEYKVFKGE